MSDPDVDHARAALAKLEHLVVQDIFLTETAYLADVVLPATAWPEKTGTVTNTDRMVQLGRKALEPPGEARQDLWIISRARRSAWACDWNYQHPQARSSTRCAGCMDSIARHHLGAPGARLGGDLSVRARGRSGRSRWCSSTHFPTPTGRAKFVPADLIPAAERPDAEYPMVLITGRQLEHWHTGAMTRRAGVLDAIEPEPTASMHPLRPARSCGITAGRRRHGRVAPRRDRALCARRRRHAARRGLHPVRVLRSGGEHAHQPGARPVRQDPRVQVLRGEGDQGRCERPADPGYGKGRTLAEIYRMKILVAVRRLQGVPQGRAAPGRP